ncbi:hypothetical protein pdam_00024378 [Pocillopora damicornis]|uniref:Uncharacterized protein n=1 Tax=Pocillopora damicornis TaxID=46731 RepID=A0A3M6UBQ6_POCDA|nr:hypothetical protein pdam_00024378 [Pocillopora damicornis]
MKRKCPYPKVRIFAELGLGFVGSAMILWHNCFSHSLISKVVFDVAFFVTVSLAVFLLAVTLTKNLETDSTESQSATDTSLSENKMPMAIAALLLACLVLILSGVPHSELLYEDLEEVAIFKEVLFPMITKFAVGIVLPMTLHDLINSSYVGNKFKTVTASVL